MLKLNVDERCDMSILPLFSSDDPKQSEMSSRNFCIDEMGCGQKCLVTVTSSKCFQQFSAKDLLN